MVVPNMGNIAFQAAASAAKLRLTPRYTTFPTVEELRSPDATCMLTYITALVKNLSKKHRRTFHKMIRKAYPELTMRGLPQLLLALVVRCWLLRASASYFALHDFIEFCAGSGNLSLECLRQQLFGIALDITYSREHDMRTRLGLRIWIDSISETVPGALVWHGTRCSAFSGMSRRNHKRCAENKYWGDTSRRFVREGNIMMALRVLGGSLWGVTVPVLKKSEITTDKFY